MVQLEPQEKDENSNEMCGEMFGMIVRRDLWIGGIAMHKISFLWEMVMLSFALVRKEELDSGGSDVEGWGR